MWSRKKNCRIALNANNHNNANQSTSTSCCHTSSNINFIQDTLLSTCLLQSGTAQTASKKRRLTIKTRKTLTRPCYSSASLLISLHTFSNNNIVRDKIKAHLTLRNTINAQNAQVTSIASDVARKIEPPHHPTDIHTNKIKFRLNVESHCHQTWLFQNQHAKPKPVPALVMDVT